MSWRIWLLLIFLILAAVTIINFKAFEAELQIKEVLPGSAAYEAGIRAGELLKKINDRPITSLEAYSEALAALNISPTKFEVLTENGSFSYESTTLDFEVDKDVIIAVRGKAKEAALKVGMKVLAVNGLALANYSFEAIKQRVEPKAKINVLTDKQEYIFLTPLETGLRVEQVPATKLKTGLDLQGGARALVRPERPLTASEMASLLDTIRFRLNVYGLQDINVREVRDLEGNQYMLVELAGATPAELRELVEKQGKFEAKIGNETVFLGGRKDITFVCRGDPACARVEFCTSQDGREVCRFGFEIRLSPEAAERHAAATAGLTENISTPGYLNETLKLYLDDKLVSELSIDVDLRGKPATAIRIEGPGFGATREEAYRAAEAEMKKLQTILITGSLPFKLSIVKLDQISPTLGKEFIRNVILAALAAFVGVCAFIYFKYKRPILFFPILLTLISEIVLILFIAVLIRWNLDLASIAGIIAAIGTGVDDQIVIIDETRLGKEYSLKERIKRAFTIIFGAYATTVIALIPLWWAGTGLLKGFAITTWLGITVGVFITRPAFAEILKRITKE